MIRITSDQVTPAIRSLFRTDEMAATRCFTVLDGAMPSGKIIVTVKEFRCLAWRKTER